MKIAIYDYLVIPTNPAGSCHRALIAALAEEHEFTVFSSQFDNPAPERVEWVRVPTVRRPLAALYLTFHLASIVRYLRERWSMRRFSIIQSVESNMAFGDVVYSHFCHRWFLKNRWAGCGARGLRGAMRWLDHWAHALVEPWSFRRARWIVSPSEGLARELREEYPFAASKIHVIPNPVDLDSFRPTPSFDRETFRAQLGFAASDKVVVFVALGHFELKGLPLLIEALRDLPEGWKLVVVGGMPDLVAKYSLQVRAMGLSESVVFVGTQENVRPYLWSADLFSLPSAYEVFPLSVLQAAAARCPILITSLNGTEEYLVDGESCLIVTADSSAVLGGLRRFGRLSREERRNLGERAQMAVGQYGLDRFATAWRDFYRGVASEATRG
jgi:glycosyltransferase involved in cell wall biosynthesis